MDRAHFIQFVNCINRAKDFRLQHLESMVQGEGGYKLVMERIQQVEQESQDRMDELDDLLDQRVEQIMMSVMVQLTKMEEMQGMVLNANFESVAKYFKHIERKVKQVNGQDAAKEALRGTSS